MCFDHAELGQALAIGGLSLIKPNPELSLLFKLDKLVNFTLVGHASLTCPSCGVEYV